MKRQLRSLFPVLALTLITACSSAPGISPDSSAAPIGEAGWAGQMQRLQGTLSEMLPLISDLQKYNDPANSATIEKNLSALKGMAHKIEKVQKPDSDPSVQLIASRFIQNIELANESFKDGHKEFSRGIARNALSQCVQCHTRVEYGPQLSKPGMLSSLEKLNIVDRVQFLIASRYFEEARTLIETSLKNATNENISAISWQKLTQLGLVISVRFNNDPTRALSLIKTIEDNGNTPYFLRRNLSYWKSGVNDWRVMGKATNPIQASKKLIEKAEKLNMESRSDGGLVHYLLAARMLHENLAFKETGLIQAEALYNLGIIYESVTELGAWNMNEDYYELCVQKAPHSEMAKKCFAKLEESLVTGFSGSSGINIPTDVQQRLNSIRALAL